VAGLYDVRLLNSNGVGRRAGARMRPFWELRNHAGFEAALSSSLSLPECVDRPSELRMRVAGEALFCCDCHK
jgi:hypothetical protein